MEGVSGRTSAPPYLLELTENGLVVGDHVLARPQFDSPNYRFIKFLLEHSNEVLSLKDVIAAAGLPNNGTKRLPHYINELRFRGLLRELFWPTTQGGYVQLANPVTVERLEKFMPADWIDSVDFDVILTLDKDSIKESLAN